MESSTGKYCLLKKFLSCNYPSETRLEFVIQISNQPNKESLKYKGLWKTLEHSGVNIDIFENKDSIFKITDSGIDLLGYAELNVKNIDAMIGLINKVDCLYFSLGKYDKNCFDNYQDWIDFKLSKCNLVLFFASDLWEELNELIIIKNDIDVFELNIDSL